MQESDPLERVKAVDIVMLDRSKITVPLQRIVNMGGMKTFIADQSGMRIEDLKLVRNGKKINQPDNTPIADLNITEKDTIILLSYEPHTTTQITNNKSKKIALQQQNMSSTNSIKITKGKKENIDPSIFTVIHVRNILSTILSLKFFKQNSEKIMTHEGQWQKMRKIICKDNKFISEIFQKERPFITNFLIQAEPQIHTDSPKESLTQTKDLQIIQQLSRQFYKINEVILAVQMSENNISRALNILQHGKQSQLFTIQAPIQADEQLFIFRWITNHQNRILRIKLSLDPKYIDIYLNSVKHRCQDLFKLLLKHKKYLQKIIAKPCHILMEY